MADKNGSHSGLEGLSEKAYEIARRRQAAAAEVATMLEDEFATWFESSAATVLHACAWLAGTSLYRSFGFDAKVEPGTPVLSDKANQEGMMLLKVFMFLVDKYGIKLQPDGFAADIARDSKAVRTLLEVQQHFENRYHEIMKKHGFDYAEGARTGAVACASLMKLHCVNRTDLEPRVAATHVTMGFVEGAKTAPARLG